MVIVSDLNMTDKRHLSYNYSFLKILLEIYGNIFLFGDESQYALMKKKDPTIEKKINARFFNLDDSTKIKKILREILNVYRIYKILKFQKDKNLESTYFLSLSPFSYYFFKKIKIFFKDQKVIISFHGELENLISKDKKIWKMAYWFRKAYYKKDDCNTYYIILSEIIYKNLKINNFDTSKKFIVINHPYNFHQNLNNDLNINFLEKKGITIGAIGVARKYQKNTNIIFKLGQDLKKYINEGKLKLKIIGPVAKDMEQYLNNEVQYTKDENLLDELEFEKSISEIDYSIYFYDQNSYKFVCSGALIDSIKFLKPIIAYENDFFKFYFQKIGNIGFLENSYENLKNRVIDLIENKNKDEYISQLNNLILGKKLFSEESVKEELEKQLKKYNIKEEK